MTRLSICVMLIRRGDPGRWRQPVRPCSRLPTRGTGSARPSAVRCPMSLGVELPAPQSRSDTLRRLDKLIRARVDPADLAPSVRSPRPPEEGWGRLILADASPAAGPDLHRSRASPQGPSPEWTPPGPAPTGPAQRAGPARPGSAHPRAHQAVRQRRGPAALMTKQQADRASNCIIRRGLAARRCP